MFTTLLNNLKSGIESVLPIAPVPVLIPIKKDHDNKKKISPHHSHKILKGEVKIRGSPFF